jgi:dihydrofolate reductase
MGEPGILGVHNLSMSLDGYVAGPRQDAENPLGVGGMRLHDWVFATRTGRRMIGEPGGSTGLDDAFLRRGETGTDGRGIGATIMGRNMFGPVRGPWPGPPAAPWRGWWGEEPPYHHPVFVLTHEPREPQPMAGGTTFHFVTDGIESALALARAAAGERELRLGGGATTIRQYLRAGLVDQLHLVLVPVLLGSGERLLDDDLSGRYAVSRTTPGDGGVTHVELDRVR